MTAEWADRLAGLTDAQIRHGLDNLPADYPPSLPAFLQACRADWQHKTPAYREYPPMLEKPKAKKTTAKAELGKIREKIAEHAPRKPVRRYESVSNGVSREAYAMRCPTCKKPNLAHWGRCYACGAELKKPSTEEKAAAR